MLIATSALASEPFHRRSLTPDQRGSGGSATDASLPTSAPRPFIAGCPVEFEVRWSKIPFSHPPLPAEFDRACADKTKKVAYLAPSQLPDVGAATRPAPPAGPVAAVTTNAQKVLVELARSYIGKATLTLGSKKHFTDEAPLFVRAVLKQAGHDPFEGKKRWKTANKVMWIWFHSKQANTVHFQKRPNVGDVVFFNNTFDLNRDKLTNDWFSHVGIVEEIDADGTVTFIQRGPEGIGRRKMNLLQPRARRDPSNSKVWNSVLRLASKADNAQVPRLSSELFAGFATFAK